MVTGPVAVSMVTGNPAATVVVGVAVVVVVAGGAVVVVAALPQAARTAQTANARKGVLRKKHPPYRRMKESVGSETARFRLHPRRFVCAEEAGGLARLAVCRKPRFSTRRGITAAGQRPDSHRDFAAFFGPLNKRGVGEYRFEIRQRGWDGRFAAHRATFEWRWNNSCGPSSAGCWH